MHANATTATNRAGIRILGTGWFLDQTTVANHGSFRVNPRAMRRRTLVAAMAPRRSRVRRAAPRVDCSGQHGRARAGGSERPTNYDVPAAMVRAAEHPAADAAGGRGHASRPGRRSRPTRSALLIRTPMRARPQPMEVSRDTRRGARPVSSFVSAAAWRSALGRGQRARRQEGRAARPHVQRPAIASGQLRATEPLTRRASSPLIVKKFVSVHARGHHQRRGCQPYVCRRHGVGEDAPDLPA